MNHNKLDIGGYWQDIHIIQVKSLSTFWGSSFLPSIRVYERILNACILFKFFKTYYNVVKNRIHDVSV